MVEFCWKRRAVLLLRWPSGLMGSSTGRFCWRLHHGCASEAHPAMLPPSLSESNWGKAVIKRVQHCEFYVLLDAGDQLAARWTGHGSRGRPAGEAELNWAWSQCYETLVL